MRNLFLMVIATTLLAGCSIRPQIGEPVCTCIGILPGTQGDLVENVGDRVFFGFDNAAVDGTANRATLMRQSLWMQHYSKVNVHIAGNCDERGTEEYNLALGQKRATMAKAYLVANGVAPGRITIISYGKDRPSAAASDKAAWAKNRKRLDKRLSGASQGYSGHF